MAPLCIHSCEPAMTPLCVFITAPPCLLCDDTKGCSGIGICTGRWPSGGGGGGGIKIEILHI